MMTAHIVMVSSQQQQPGPQQRQPGHLIRPRSRAQWIGQLWQSIRLATAVVCHPGQDHAAIALFINVQKNPIAIFRFQACAS
jgi:hypothetical protein